MKVLIPIRTNRGQNEREHHQARARRVRAEKLAVAWSFKAARHTPPAKDVPVVVLTRRIAPNSKGLDKHDNLPGALKAIVDGVAEWLGRDDADPSIQWEYAQRPGKKDEWAVEIEITC